MEEKKRKQYANLYEHSSSVKQEKSKHENRHRRTIEKVCRRIAVSFLAMAVVLLMILLHIQIKNAKEDAVLEYIRQEKEQLQKKDTEESNDSVAILDQYAILYSIYPDTVGWLTVDGTQIDYPVMQDTTGEDYYLQHNFEGKEDNRGALFVSSDASIDPLYKNLVIFGHNISDGSQFGELDAYLDQSFYEQHSTITFDTIYETGTYQIVAVVKTHVRQESEDGFRYYWFRGYENRSEFQELLDFIKENKIYDTGQNLSYGDTTIMLSTCEYTVDNGRLVIIAKRM
jgi:sortase B